MAKIVSHVLPPLKVCKVGDDPTWRLSMLTGMSYVPLTECPLGPMSPLVPAALVVPEVQFVHPLPLVPGVLVFPGM